MIYDIVVWDTNSAKDYLSVLVILRWILAISLMCVMHVFVPNKREFLFLIVIIKP